TTLAGDALDRIMGSQCRGGSAFGVWRPAKPSSSTPNTQSTTPMASALTDKLSRLAKELRGQARITEANVQDMLREVRMALLEADVALPVVRDFIARVKDKALGQEVLGSLSPGQALVGIVSRELAATMGEGISD